MSNAMHIEHVGYTVADPAAVAQWYCQHLDFRVVRRMEKSPFTHFLVDGSGRMLIEIYNNPAAAVPDYAAQDPLILHLAFAVEDVAAHRARLLSAGATVHSEKVVTPAGDELLMLRDPWGFPVQLCKRGVAMV